MKFKFKKVFVLVLLFTLLVGRNNVSILASEVSNNDITQGVTQQVYTDKVETRGIPNIVTVIVKKVDNNKVKVIF